MGTVGGSGSGAAAQAHISVDMKQQAPGSNRENVAASCWRGGRTGCQKSRREERVGGGHDFKLESYNLSTPIASLFSLKTDYK